MTTRCPIHGPVDYVGQCCDPDVHEWDCRCGQCEHQRAVEADAHEAYTAGIEGGV